MRGSRLPRRTRTSGTGDHDLLITPLCQFLRLCHRQFQRRAADGATGIGNDAVGAEIDAAILHLHHGAGTLFQTARGQDLEFPAAQGVVHTFPMGAVLCRFQQQTQEFLTAAAAANHIDAHFTQFFRCVLGIAAADRQNRLRMVLLAAADNGTVFLVRNSCDGASVNDVTVADFVKTADLVSLFQQQTLHRLRFILVCLAAKGVKSKFHSYFHQ